jgi:hypothetical protein
MTVESIVIICLVAVIAFQQWFYVMQIHKFTDKIMSGNYATYAQTQAFLQENKPQGPQEFRVQLPQHEEYDELAQLNAMLKPPLP